MSEGALPAYTVRDAGEIERLWRRASRGELPDASEGGSAYFEENSGASAAIWNHIAKHIMFL